MSLPEHKLMSGEKKTTVVTHESISSAKQDFKGFIWGYVECSHSFQTVYFAKYIHLLL